MTQRFLEMYPVRDSRRYEGISWSENVSPTLSGGVPAWGEGEFNSTLAYGLCALSLVLVSGLHRIYLGDICCGVLYCLTSGWCCIGDCIDLCNLSSMVSSRNEEIHKKVKRKATEYDELHSQPPQQPSQPGQPQSYPPQNYVPAGYPQQGYPPPGPAQGYPAPQGYVPPGQPQGYPPQQMYAVQPTMQGQPGAYPAADGYAAAPPAGPPPEALPAQAVPNAPTDGKD
ncbi:hypothetical protein BLNAU_21258 [Blattamonas nauphoetae]|uniref:TM2 domain-containing protein n=1 Tax=Blattamonas nauphoetae TaxID=2049346 RepID=A0ABQ9WWC4_9EUKA|nr:hypothetical protein BLNAU_21258 [Blattamonas nauphoetae]